MSSNFFNLLLSPSIFFYLLLTPSIFFYLLLTPSEKLQRIEHLFLDLLQLVFHLHHDVLHLGLVAF